LAKAIHSMVRVLDEKRSVDFYKKAFNLTVADRLDFSGFTLVYLSNEESDFELELTINKDQNDAYELGSGYGHFAVSVDNLDSEHSRLEAEGLAPRKLVEFAPDGKLIARFFFICARFFFICDPDGYEIEVLERSGRFQ